MGDIAIHQPGSVGDKEHGLLTVEKTVILCGVFLCGQSVHSFHITVTGCAAPVRGSRPKSEPAPFWGSLLTRKKIGIHQRILVYAHSC